MPSGGEERNAYRHSLLWLVQFKTSGNCLSFSFKDFFVTLVSIQYGSFCYY